MRSSSLRLRTGLLLLSVPALVAIGVTLASSSDRAASQAPASPSAAFSVFSASGPRPTEADATALHDASDPANRSPFVLDGGLDRVAQRDSGSTIYARAGSSGVCIRDVERSGAGGGACAGLPSAGDPATPIIGVVHTGTDQGFRLVGLVPDDVAAVTVTLPDGSTANPQIVNNTFAQIVGSGDTRIEWASADGQQHEATMSAADTPPEKVASP